MSPYTRAGGQMEALKAGTSLLKRVPPFMDVLSGWAHNTSERLSWSQLPETPPATLSPLTKPTHQKQKRQQREMMGRGQRGWGLGEKPVWSGFETCWARLYTLRLSTPLFSWGMRGEGKQREESVERNQREHREGRVRVRLLFGSGPDPHLVWVYTPSPLHLHFYDIREMRKKEESLEKCYKEDMEERARIGNLLPLHHFTSPGCTLHPRNLSFFFMKELDQKHIRHMWKYWPN